jgi:hypothetical protein
VRKLLVVLILFFASQFLPAQTVFIPETVYGDEEMEEDFEAEPEALPEKKRFRLKNRTLELSTGNFSYGFSNSFIGAYDLFRNPFDILLNIKDIINEPNLLWNDPVSISTDDFFSGFKLNVYTTIKPFSFNFNWKDKWGFGLDIGHIDVSGNVSISQNLLTIQEAEEETFGVGAAVFADAGIPFFFHAGDVKVKLRPAVYLPVVYTKPGITYTRRNVTSDNGWLEGMFIDVKYDMRIYSILNMDGIQDNPGDVILQGLENNYLDILKNNLGYDFCLNVEYPWDNWLDLGVNFVNIPVPFLTARLNHYMYLKGEVSFDTSKIDLDALIKKKKKIDSILEDAFSYPKDIEDMKPEYEYNSKGEKIYRPFATLFYANYRPFNTEVFSLIPSLGFSINHLYPQLFAIEGGLNARIDLANIFIAIFGINYNDRRWINSMDFVLNLRAFEFNFGLSMQSQNFRKSWKGAGLGINLGFKLGW